MKNIESECWRGKKGAKFWVVRERRESSGEKSGAGGLAEGSSRRGPAEVGGVLRREGPAFRRSGPFSLYRPRLEFLLVLLANFPCIYDFLQI